MVEAGTKAFAKPLITLSVFGETQQFKVISKVPADGDCVVADTKISVSSESQEEGDMEETKDTAGSSHVPMEAEVYGAKFAGFKSTVKSIAELFAVKFTQSQVQDIKGVLVHGPAGIGKSMLLSHVLSTFDSVRVVQLSPATLIEGGD